MRRGKPWRASQAVAGEGEAGEKRQGLPWNYRPAVHDWHSRIVAGEVWGKKGYHLYVNVIMMDRVVTCRSCVFLSVNLT